MIERFSASVAGRHMACHASANLGVAIPNWQPPVVDEMAGAKGKGTRMHALLEPMMDLTPRELDGMAKVLRYVADIRAGRRFSTLVESPVRAAWLSTQPTTTADLVLYTQDEIHVFDWKFGKIPVEVIGNEQLLYYAVCYAPLAPKAKGVMLHVLQPPADQYESWFADTNVIAQFMAAAQATELAVLQGDVTFGPSDHCKFCPANPHGRSDKGKPLCPAMMKLLYPPIVDESEILGL